MSTSPEAWLNEKLWCGADNYILRRVLIWRFTVDDLIPFLKSHKYVLNLSGKEMASGIASVLFYNKGYKLLGPVYTERNDYSIEHKQHYNHVIDSTEWDSLWKRWSLWEDVSLDFQDGFYRRLDIQEYCWSQIDLDSSEQTRIVEEFMDGGESNAFYDECED
jgi:hypothetical protein